MDQVTKIVCNKIQIKVNFEKLLMPPKTLIFTNLNFCYKKKKLWIHRLSTPVYQATVFVVFAVRKLEELDSRLLAKHLFYHRKIV